MNDSAFDCFFFPVRRDYGSKGLWMEKIRHWDLGVALASCNNEEKRDNSTGGTVLNLCRSKGLKVPVYRALIKPLVVFESRKYEKKVGTSRAGRRRCGSIPRLHPRTYIVPKPLIFLTIYFNSMPPNDVLLFFFRNISIPSLRRPTTSTCPPPLPGNGRFLAIVIWTNGRELPRWLGQ